MSMLCLMREGLVADERKMLEPETRRIQDGESRKGYDLLSGPPPKGSLLSPDQAAGIATADVAPSPPSDQSGQSSHNEK
jgi:hypothetical protein